MPDRQELADLVQRTENYLTTALLPFWLDNAPDREQGGVLTYFDQYGKPTGETAKPFLMQTRMLCIRSPARIAPATAADAVRSWRGTSPTS